ncbi:MAG: DUF262 domain-containing protein [Pseudomonadota bacterium]
MSQTLFAKMDTTAEYLVSAVDQGDIGLPDIQRPFVWSASSVRDLFDSMFKGYPVGYLMLWDNPNESSSRQIGTAGHGQDSPTTLIIDGQQRLTSLYAVMKGKPVLDKNFHERFIVIGFNPLKGKFEVTSSAIKRSSEWLPDLSAIFKQGTDSYSLVTNFLERLRSSREVSGEEQSVIAKNIQRLLELKNYPFSALKIGLQTDEEQVADIFVRVNSKGQNLKQADFILTLLSVFWEEGRQELEAFCRDSRMPPTPGSGASPFNRHIKPDPDQLLRVAIAVGLRRARLKYAYQFLRGKDVESGEFVPEVREANLKRLASAQQKMLSLTNWHQFLKCLTWAGFRSGKQISSDVALLYSYAFYLIGKTEYGLDYSVLRQLIGRYFFMITLTSRYTGSFESAMDEDMARLRGIHSGEEFAQVMQGIIDTNLTDDFWKITLPGNLETSSSSSAYLNAYHAAQNILGAKVLFSDVKIHELLDPEIAAPKSALEIHHLFPKAYLKSNRITETRIINQIANYALVEWEDNIDISDSAPSEYIVRYEDRYHVDLESRYKEHALPAKWYEMSYDDFLQERRKLMAEVICQGFSKLS